MRAGGDSRPGDRQHDHLTEPVRPPLALTGAPALLGALDLPLLLVGLGLAVLLPVVPFSLEMLALRRLTAAAFGTLMALEPAIASVVGLIALHQVPGWGAVAGVGFVVAAGIGAERTGSRPAVESPGGATADVDAQQRGARGRLCEPAR